MVIEPRTRDVGNFSVRRILPVARRRMVGPFVFFDHMGPTRMPTGGGLDIPPHPHIGLSTLTYLFEGSLMHRDSLGSRQLIHAGDVNWMTAGRGIVHSERTPDNARDGQMVLDAIQTWIALPLDHETDAPGFHHADAADMPVFQEGGATLRLVAGAAFGRISPVPVSSPLFYLDAVCLPDTSVALPPELGERAVYVARGDVQIGDTPLRTGQMAVLHDGEVISIEAKEQTRLVLIGGAPLEGKRHIWWNFVSSSLERIEQAKADWAAQRMGQVPDETEFVPLPDFGG